MRVFLVFLITMLYSCSDNRSTGVVSETTNGISALLILPDGTPARNAELRILPADSIPDSLHATLGLSKASDSYSTSQNSLPWVSVHVDEEGSVHSGTLPKGEYLAEAVWENMAGRFFRFELDTETAGENPLDLDSIALAPLGALHIYPLELESEMQVRIPGTPYGGTLSNNTPLLFNSLPSGDLIVEILEKNSDKALFI